MSSSSFDFLEGWTSDDSNSLSASETELDFSPDEALLLADLIASVTDKPASTATATASASSQRHPAAPDIEDHEYLRLALEETFLPDDDSISDSKHQHQTARNPIQLDPKDADKDRDNGDRGNGDRGNGDRGNGDKDNGDRDRDSDDQEEDSRTPLERFRRPPMKGLSVSDLVSPAWCELQYTYTLLHGPKETTPAMKRGTVVHQKLENEIHTSVPVTVLSKEDAWALRIWNVIYALRTLRDTGITREMEVWGMLDGEIVTGVIDCLSRDRPTHADLLPLPTSTYSGVRSTKRLHNTRAGWAFEHVGQNIPLCEKEGIYITEVKTRDAARSNRRLPGLDSPSFRPARIQLQLYYHFLTRMVESEDVSVFDIAERYGLKPHAPLSDAFLAQVGSINDDYFENEACSWSQSRPDEEDASSVSDRLDSLTVLLNHNSLSNLWDLLKENLRLTFLRPSTNTSTDDSAGDEQVTLLSPILTVSYMAQDRSRSASPTTDTDKESEDTESKDVPTDAESGSESGSNTPTPSETHNYTQLGTRSFVFDPESLYPYLIEGLAWWHGRRPAHAIPVSQAWKCQSCDFRGTCSWRRQQFEMHMQKIRERGNS
ncbi:exonuclease V [Trichophyton mentagrophytes]|nr:exonuclease V [Trichophyton mentagrophytes]